MNLLGAGRDLLLAFGLLGLCCAVGHRALLHGRWSFEPVDRLLLSLGLGLGLIGTSVLVWGGLGLLGPSGLLVLFGGWIALGAWTLPQTVRLAARVLREIGVAWGRFEFLVLAVAATFVLTHAALPPTDFDSLFYHLTIPDLYLEAGRVYFPPNYPHAAFIGVVHMLYVPLLAAGGAAAPALFGALIALTLPLLAYRVGERFFGREAGRLASVLIWGAPILLLVARTPRVDVVLVWFLLLGHYLVLLALEEVERPSVLWLAGVVLGIGVGVKLNALLYVAGVAVVFLLVAIRRSASWAGRVRASAWIAFGLFLGSAPWLLKNWVLLDGSLYPLAGARPVEAWLRSVYPDGVPPDTLSVVPPLRQIRSPFSLQDWFFDPKRLTPEGEGRFYFANPVLTLLPLWALKSKGAAKLWLALPPLIYMTLLLLRSEYVNLRYLVPTMVPLTVLVAAIMAELTGSQVRRVVGRLVLLPAALSLTFLPSLQPVFAFIAGETTKAELSQNRLGGELTSYVNEELAPDSRILMLFDSRGFYLDAQVIPDPDISNWLNLVPAVRTGCLDNAEITHILLNRTILAYHSGRGLHLASIQWDKFREFANECLSLIWQGSSYDLYAFRR